MLIEELWNFPFCSQVEISKLHMMHFCREDLFLSLQTVHTVYINKKFQHKIVNIFSQLLAYVLGAQKNRLIETVLLSTHNICFG